MTLSDEGAIGTELPDAAAGLTLSDGDSAETTAPDREAYQLVSDQPPAGRRDPPARPAPAGPVTPREPAAVPPASDAFRRQFLASFLQLRRTPAMFGDSFSGGTFSTCSHSTGQGGGSSQSSCVVADLPLAGGSRRVKVAEHNKPFADDRVYFLYNHFHNALEAAPAGLPGGRSFDVNRCTLGMEKSFAEGLWSAELRMPFTGGSELQAGDPATYSADGGEVGDLAAILKLMLYQDACGSLAAGLGVNLPTGSGARAVALGTDYRVENQAVSLLPYIGCMLTPDERVFCQAFAQLDFALNGDEVSATIPGWGSATGKLNEQTLLYLDVTAGYWLWSDASRCWFPGVAALVEFHYTSTLQDADRVDAFGTFGNAVNRFDVVNLTAGIHVEVTGKTDLRVGGVFPLRGGDERFFDSEVNVSLIRHF